MRRNTPQREAVLAVLGRADRPLSPEEILEGARKRVPGLGIATVYRHLGTLCKAGELRIVELPGGGRRYDGAGKGHRHHFRCRVCDRLFSVKGCPGGINALAPDGFLVESHDILLLGQCTGCQEVQR